MQSEVNGQAYKLTWNVYPNISMIALLEEAIMSIYFLDVKSTLFSYQKQL